MMVTLHVDNFPEELFLQIQRLAKQQNISLDALVVILLTQTLQLEKARERSVQIKALASLRQRRFVPPMNSPSSLALLHEDRNR